MKYDLLREFRETVENQKIEEFMIESIIDPIRSHLNLYFYNAKHSNHNTRLYGSFLRETAIVGSSQIDILYFLPDNLRSHISVKAADAYVWMIDLLSQIFSGTPWTIEFDERSKTFLIGKSNPWPIRLKPVFYLNDERFATLESLTMQNGAVFKPFVAESRFRATNFNSNRNLEILAKTVRYWVRANQVPIGGFLIDCLAMNFIQSSPYRRLSRHYQDCLLRDFLFHLSKIEPHQESWTIEGTSDQVYRSGHFEVAAERAYHLAERMIANSLIRQDVEAKAALRDLIGDIVALSPHASETILESIRPVSI